MKTRVITALVGVPVLLAALIIRGWFAEILIVALTLIALSECYKALRTADYCVCTWGGYFAAIVMWPRYTVMDALDPLLLITSAMGISMLGVLLSSKIEESTIGGKKVFNVADGFLYACFDADVTEETITEIAKRKPYYFVMRDSSMASDSVATNFDQIFATYSPDTVRKVL